MVLCASPIALNYGVHIKCRINSHWFHIITVINDVL